MYVKLLKLVSSFKYVPLENTTSLEVKSKCPVQLSTPPTLPQEIKNHQIHMYGVHGEGLRGP